MSSIICTPISPVRCTLSVNIPRCLPSSSSALSLSAMRISRSMPIPASVGICLTLTEAMAAVSSALAFGSSLAFSKSTTSAALTNATFASSRTMRSWLTPVRRDSSAMAASMRARISGLCRFSEPIDPAVSGLYPARIAACVAHRSMRYSSTNRFCLLVMVSLPFGHEKAPLFPRVPFRRCFQCGMKQEKCGT